MIILPLVALLSLSALAIDKKTFDPEAISWEKENYTIDRKKAGEDPFIALTKLIGGNRRFIENKSIRPRQDKEVLTKLKEGQSPFAVIVGCADSRVPNEIIFDQGLGDLFIIRTAGQVAAEASYGSMEFAVTALKTKLIVVLGHTKCGAVAAAVSRPKNVPPHVTTLINSIKPSALKCEGMPGDKVENTSRQNVIDQVNQLRNLEPVLSDLYSRGEILIVGGIYDINTGKVEFLKETLADLPVK